MAKDLYIFDLDGTLADIEHRRPLIADKKNQHWDDFYRACIHDRPNKPVLLLFNKLWKDSDIYIFSGRSDLVLKETIQWLRKYTDLSISALFDILKMRSHGDSTEDATLKKGWYDQLSDYDKSRLVCIFDDRQKVVDMWRSLGLTCLQVAEGAGTKWI